MSYPTYVPNIGNHVADLIDDEIGRAKAKHGPKKFNSKHEGFAVLQEEVDELWDAVKKDESKERLLEESVQVAAMAIRFIREIALKDDKEEQIDEKVVARVKEILEKDHIIQHYIIDEPEIRLQQLNGFKILCTQYFEADKTGKLHKKETDTGTYVSDDQRFWLQKNSETEYILYPAMTCDPKISNTFWEIIGTMNKGTLEFVLESYKGFLKSISNAENKTV